MKPRADPLRSSSRVDPAPTVKTASGLSSGLPRTRVVALSRVVTRWPAAWPFVAIGSAWVVAGGLVAAVTRLVAFELGPWTAAYLVLVGGVAQVVLGAGSAWLASTLPSVSKVRVELVAWNLGVVATIGGTLGGVPVVTTTGGVGLLLSGYWFVATPHSAGTKRPRWVLVAWWATWLLVISSVPVGVALSWARHG